jgi:hypothetical protein
MAVKMGADPVLLDQAGWGVLFEEDVNPAVEAALDPLLAHRQAQAGALFRRLTVRPGEDAASFLGRHGAGSPPIVPELVPYYLLIVASPEGIPFDFQSQLAADYAVGRLHFDALADYAAYAQRVVQIEADGYTLPRRAVLYGVVTPQDELSGLAVSGLVEPVSRMLASGPPGWRVTTVLGASATKARLGELLGEVECPALLLLSGHGLGLPTGDPRQPALQGALVCADWPGPPEPVQAGHCFAAEDLGAVDVPSGLIAVQLGSYGAGAPGPASASDPALPVLKNLRGQPFVAALPKRLLAQGALAVLGHAAEVWSYSLLDRYSEPWPSVWANVLRALMVGQPVGFALQPAQGRFAEVASNLRRELDEVSFAAGQGDLELVRLWALYRDLFSLTLLGDPAVRLPVSGMVSADLEIRLGRGEANQYLVELGFLLSETDAPAVSVTGRGEVTFDFDRLDALERSGDMVRYGRELGTSLFGPVEVLNVWTWACEQTEAQDPPVPLRLRIQVGSTASELSHFRWEFLRPPAAPSLPVAADERVIFSRHLPSSDWRPVSGRSGDTLRALVVAANPIDLREAAVLEVAGEVALAQQALGSLSSDLLASREGAIGQPTLKSLYVHLGRTSYSILYLACQVALSGDGRPVLWLEDAQGEPAALSDEDLVKRLLRLDSLPSLVVLCSRVSQVGGNGSASGPGEALGALASSLVQAGIPAVVTLGPGLSDETAARFLTILFQELQRHGTIDRATTAARLAVRDSADWGVPILYTRLTSGQLFFRAPQPATRAAEVQAATEAPVRPARGEIDLRALRELLMAAFSAQDLVRLLRYTSNAELRNLAMTVDLSPQQSLTMLVETIIKACKAQSLLPDLLEEIKRENPRQYARFEPKLRRAGS